MTAWYRAGTVTATNGSATVTGALTAWLANVKVGDAWCPDADGRGYEVTAVNSNTSITIFPVYAGTTGSGKAYGIARFSPNWNSVSEISVSLAEILAASSSIIAGNGVPSDSLGTDGDVYFRQDVAEYYTKGSGTWTLVTSLIGPQGLAGPSYQATSTSSVAIGTGSKTFTVQSGRGYSAGQWVRVSNSSSNHMEGTVTSYSGTTLIIDVPAGRAIGSGTYTSWNVNITGDVGPANSLAIGSVTTGAAGSSASATITGTAPSQTLNLTIPRGNTGATGETGPQGATGAAATITVGTVDTVNPDDPATVTNSGTSGAAVFDFEIPKGDPGTPINHRGDYNAVTTYALNDAVRVLGSTWVYINATPGSGNAPPTLPTESNSYWQLMAQAGSNGTGAVDLVNGQSGVVVLDGSDVEANYSPVNYTPSGLSIADHLAAIDTALDSVSAGGEALFGQIASATTTDIGADENTHLEVTGTTTITSFGTVANQWRFVRFAGILTLTYNATSLILPGAANITTAAGDVAVFISDSDGNWRCASYERANGRTINLGTASQAALLDEDNMASDSASSVPSQQSVKAYVDLSSPLPPGYISGLAVSNNTTDANNDVDIATGTCRNLDNTRNVTLGSAITKRLDAAWAEGTNQGGLDTGSKANSTHYFAHLIRETSSGDIDVLLSASMLNPTLPTGWTHERRLNGFLTDGSGNIRGFLFDPATGFLQYKAPYIEFADVANSGANLRTLTAVPVGKKWEVVIPVTFEAGANVSFHSITDPDALNASISQVCAWHPASGRGVSHWRGTCTASAQVSTFSQSASGKIVSMYVAGYYDDRDRRY